MHGDACFTSDQLGIMIEWWYVVTNVYVNDSWFSGGGYPLVIKHSNGKSPINGYQWRFLARKITDSYGPFSSTPCLMTPEGNINGPNPERLQARHQWTLIWRFPKWDTPNHPVVNDHYLALKPRGVLGIPHDFWNSERITINWWYVL